MAGAVLCGLAVVAWPVAACEVRTLTYRSAELACHGPKDGGAKGVRIEVRFGGFHDDSRVAIALEAGGQPVRCRPEDRTTLSGEDGDEGEVTLTCRFDAASVPHGANPVTVRVDLHHAEFAGAAWVTEATAR